MGDGRVSRGAVWHLPHFDMLPKVSPAATIAPFVKKFISIFSSIEQRRLTDILNEVPFPTPVPSKSSNFVAMQGGYSPRCDHKHSVFFDFATPTYQLFQSGTDDSSEYTAKKPLKISTPSFSSRLQNIALQFTRFTTKSRWGVWNRLGT